jgi:WD40 repeat protein
MRATTKRGPLRIIPVALSVCLLRLGSLCAQPPTAIAEGSPDFSELCFSPDATTLFAIAGNSGLLAADLGSLSRQNVASQTLSLRDALGQSVAATTVLYLDNQKIIFATAADIQVWKWKTPQQLGAFPLPPASSNLVIRDQVACSADGLLLATSAGETADPATAHCVVYETNTGKPVVELPLDSNRQIRGLALTAGSAGLLAIGDESGISLFDLGSGKKRENISVGRAVRVSGFSPDGKFLAAQDGATVSTWRMAEGMTKQAKLVLQKPQSQFVAWSQVGGVPVLYVVENRENASRVLGLAFRGDRPTEEYRTPPSDKVFWASANPLREGQRGWTFRRGNASSVAKPIAATSILQAQPAPVHVVSSSLISGEERKEAVYNLEVEDAHEYFAQSILVHNCRYILYATFGHRRSAQPWLDHMFGRRDAS